MSARDWIVLGLLAAAAAVALVSAIGLLAMRDPLQRLHFIAPPATLSAPLVTIAVGVGTRQVQPTLKAGGVAVLLLFVNGVVTHATARAARAREASAPNGRREGSRP